MSLTITQARDEMLTMVKAAIDASSYSSMPILWEDVQPNPPASDSPFLSVEVQHLFGSQTSLGSPTARFTRNGVVRSRIYCPRGAGMSTLDEIAQIVLNAFEGQSSPGGVWFRNGRLTELPADGAWARADVVVDFTYNEHK